MNTNEGKIVGGGRETLKTCPSCGREKLYENRDSGLFYCQRCQHKGKRGGSKRDALPSEPLPQLEQLQLDLGGLLSGQSFDIEPEKVEGTGLPEEFVPFFDGGWAVPLHLRGFMKGRGLTRDDLLSWGLGTCPSGLYRGRLVIPVVTRGEVTFQARLTSGEGPKYLNPAGTKGAFIHGFDRVDMRSGPVLICEGVIDAISVWRAGGVAVGLMGKSCSALQRDLLTSLKRDLIICLDGDAPRDAKSLSTQLGGCPIINIEDGSDPDSFLQTRSLGDLLSLC
jgi:hypothetical protein